MQKQGAILVLSGPSGAGKSTLINEAGANLGEFYFSVSTTTRSPREGETNGKEYYFVTKEEFESDIEAGNFLEYATVHGNYYGTSLIPVKKALLEGKLVIFDIDVQGHRLVQKALGELVTSVFITPPSLSELRERLESRCSDSQEVIDARIHNAKEEIAAVGEYDYLIVNDKLEDAVGAFVDIVRSVRRKQTKAHMEAFGEAWLKL